MNPWRAQERFRGLACHLFDSAEPGKCGETERGLMCVEVKPAGKTKKPPNPFKGSAVLILL
jgi:hypothetical protein